MDGHARAHKRMAPLLDAAREFDIATNPAPAALFEMRRPLTPLKSISGSLARGETQRLQNRRAELARSFREVFRDECVSNAVCARISKRFKELQKVGIEGMNDVPDDVFNHILHHWIWDQAKGMQTPHRGMMEAQTRFPLAPPTESDAFKNGFGKSTSGWHGWQTEKRWSIAPTT